MSIGKLVTRLLVLILLLSYHANSLGQSGWFGKRYDTVCDQHPEYDASRGTKIFAQQLQLISDALSKKRGLRLRTMLKYEASIHSEESSLGYYWSIDIGTGPKMKQFNSCNPISFDRVECPLFQGHVDYLYTKLFHKVKIVEFTWDAFRTKEELDDLFFHKDSIFCVQERKLFEQKFQELIVIITGQLATPVIRTEGKLSIKAEWKSASGVTAYLCMNFNDSNCFNKIWLLLY